MNFFQVEHPKLECQPGEFREGLKRYNFNKNMNSYNFPALTQPVNNNFIHKKTNSEINSSLENPEIIKLKLQLIQKQEEIEKLRDLAEGNIPSTQTSPSNKNYKDLSPSRVNNKSVLSSYEYNIFDIAKHPAFQQKRFTRKSPKIVTTNPIGGYNYSPDRNLGRYGNMIIGSKIIQ